MSKLSLSSSFKIFLGGNSSWRFLIGATFSFAFAMSVILCTIGLMDGFEFTLKKALSHANGDIKLTSHNTFFRESDQLKNKINSISGVKLFSSVLQVEAFALPEASSKGILLKGIEPLAFENITSLPTKKIGDGIIIGSVFAEKYRLGVGEQLSIAMASNKTKNQGSALLFDFEIVGIVNHGIFEKDMRFIYVDKTKLEQILDYKKNVSNIGLIKLETLANLKSSMKELEEGLGDEFFFEPFWSEFEVLLNAVEVEKLSISLVLQLIVLVAILNIIAFMLYISEIKSQDFFMLRALGLKVKFIQRFWALTLFNIWLFSIMIAYLLKNLFAYLIANLPFLKIPGDIYVLSELKVILSPTDYIQVYGLSLIWILLIGFFVMKKWKNVSVIAGLREEFS